MLKRYLKERKESDVAYRGYPFVTISRQPGTYANELAAEILRVMQKPHGQKLFEGWEVFDRSVCDLVTQDKDLDGSLNSLVAEVYDSEVSKFVYEMVFQKSEQFSGYKRIFEIVRILGTLGKAIIIGRGGSYVTHDMPNGIHLRLIASEPWRLKQTMEKDRLNEKEALKQIHAREKDRARLIRDFFTKDIQDPTNYTAVFNVEHVTVSELAPVVVEMIRQKAALLDR